MRKESKMCLGKVRANFIGSEFIAYSNGLNPKKTPVTGQGSIHLLREELCAVTYSSTLWGKKPRGPRKMNVITPRLKNDNERLVCRPTRGDGSDGLLNALKMIQENSRRRGWWSSGFGSSGFGKDDFGPAFSASSGCMCGMENRGG